MPADHQATQGCQLEGWLGPSRLGFLISEGLLRDGRHGNIVLTRPSAWATSLGWNQRETREGHQPPSPSPTTPLAQI